MNVQKGQRDKLEKYLNTNQEIEIVLNVSGTSVYDFTCFGLDTQSKLADEAYMIFYNQEKSPKQEICYRAVGNEAKFSIRLDKLPDKIQKIAFTVSIDGAGNMGMIAGHVVQIRQNNNVLLEMSLLGADFRSETAIISMEIYKKDVWRFSMVVSGFNGGLGDLLRYYGGEEEIQAMLATAQSQPTPPVQSRPAPSVQNSPVQTQNHQSSAQPPVASSSPAKISLEKKLEQGAPKLVSLAKPLKVSLEKRNMQDCVARVALVMDISGSMSTSYKNGTVQSIVDKTLPLAVQFDDDGELDFWYYGTTCRKMPSVNMSNYESAVPKEWKELRASLGGRNNEVLVMEDVVKTYNDTKLPVYVLFITDGGVSNSRGISKILKDVSNMPIFWQFVGVSGSNYGILEKLDTMEGRYVDNASFFALDDFMSVSNEDLYDRLLNEFPEWLREIKAKGMI